MAAPTRRAPAAGDDPALAAIAAHERLCEERMESIRGSLQGIETALCAHEAKFDTINTAAWGVAGTLALLALSIIAYLFVQVWPPNARAALPAGVHGARPAPGFVGR